MGDLSVLASLPKLSSASSRLVGAVRSLIMTERPPPGTRIGSERELVAASGFSRPTVREAIRILEREGLLQVKPGPGGGLIVRGLDHVQTTRSLSDLLQFEETPPQAFLEARTEIEATCARLAAMHATADNLAAIADTIVDLEATDRVDSPFIAETNVRFHLAVAEASKNHVLLRITQSLVHLVLRSTILAEYTGRLKQDLVRAHQRILDAISHGDSLAADRRMRRHMVGFVEYLTQTGQMNRLVKWVDTDEELLGRLRGRLMVPGR
jgi:DNA-binding FadR family transcriptional regulator